MKLPIRIWRRNEDAICFWRLKKLKKSCEISFCPLKHNGKTLVEESTNGCYCERRRRDADTSLNVQQQGVYWIDYRSTTAAAMSMNGLIGGVVCVVWPDRCKNSAVVWMNEWPAHRRPQWDEAIDITHNNTSAAAAVRRWQWQWKSFSPASSLALRQLQQLYRLYRFTFQSSGRGIYKQNFAINIKRKERGRRCIRRPDQIT